MINSVKTNLFWLVLIALSSLTLKANKYTPVKARKNTPAYIEQYKTIVVNEMQRTGIPASIKMAQAILESGSGQSTLARQSNNHFGIKCGKDWTGGTVYREDDDYKDGLLIRSCFRAYDDPANSFIAHSDFLLKNRRYNFLFELDSFDYIAWANGLKKAGYATDPKYPNKLISLIEEYQLYNLDLGISIEVSDEIFVNVDDQDTNSPIQNQSVDESGRTIITVKNSSGKYTTGYTLKDGYYTFKKGDNMNAIANHFKLKTKELYFKNRLAYGAQPQVGEKLVIRSYIHFKDIPATTNPQAEIEEDFLFEEVITVSSF